jgi:hypothetical protein
MTATEWRTLEDTIQKLTPGEKLELIELVARSLRTAGEAPSASRQRDALQALRSKLAALPVRNAADGFSNRNHDAVLYGDS